ncbi:MAG: hypothetical protein KBD01_17805 [Acidobacteria bacterium]|nr:hypothetical protein [Acidobacteriota bacterium]
MNPMLFAALAAALLLVAVVLVVRGLRAEKRRTAALEQASQSLGLTFEPLGDLDQLKSVADLPLFGRGHSRKVRHLMTGRAGDNELRVFDYRYTTGSGKHSHTWSQTVALLPVASAFPEFVLAPENFLHRVGQIFGYQDIDFENAPAFSSRYLLRGPDETAIRAAFGADRIALLEGERGWTVESRTGHLGIYRSDERARPEELQTFVMDVQRVWQAFL